MLAQIRVLSKDYTNVELFFVFLAMSGAGCSMVLWIVDGHRGKVLQRPEYDAKESEVIFDEGEVLNASTVSGRRQSKLRLIGIFLIQKNNNLFYQSVQQFFQVLFLLLYL